jgi:hypothetical protein
MSAVVSNNNNNNNTTIAVLGETASLEIAQNPSNHNQFLVTLSGDKKAHKVDAISLFQLDIYTTAVFVAYQRKVKPRLTMRCLFSLTTVKFCSISHLFKCAYINK